MTTKDTNISTTDNNTSAKTSPDKGFSFSKMVEPASLSEKVKWVPALENLFEEAFGIKYKPSIVSEIMSAMDIAEAKKFFKNQRKGYTAEYFLNSLSLSSVEKTDIKDVSIRLRRKDWNSIDAIVTDSDNCMIKKYGKYPLFLAFLIYCRQRGISFPKKSLPPLSQPLFHVAGNKTWLKDVFCEMIEQLLKEKDITTPLDLFGGSGALTNFIADYCYKNNLSLDLRYNDIDAGKRNFFNCFQESPKNLRDKCEKLLDSYDYHREKKNDDEIREIINYAKTFMGKKGVHGAVAFWFANILDDNDEISSTKRKSLEDFKYIAELYNLNKVIVEGKSNVLYRLNEFADNEHAFIMVDPPYPFTRGYQHARANEDFSMDSHKKLCERLVTAKATWVYFGRTDAPRSYYGDEDKEKLAEKDAQHLAFLDDSFENKGFYYMDVKAKNNTERIISNFPFKGFKPYGDIPSFVEDENITSSVDDEVITSSVETENEENIVPLIEEKENSVEVVSEDINTVIGKNAKKKAKKNTLKKVLRRVFNRRL